MALPAQTPEATAGSAPRLSPEAVASLVTYTPGDELYTAFGHSAVRIRDDALGFDRLYNYGTFDFETPNFYLKFAKGDLLYLLSVGPALAEMDERGELGQGVTERVLDLGPGGRQTLFDALERNLAPENRGYLYDFLLDNCSTRIRDLFERLTLQPLAASVPEGQTFRGMLDPYLQRIPWTRWGLYLLLGAGVDRPVYARGACFLPADLERAVLAGSYHGHPLVSDTVRYFEPQPLAQPIRWLEPLPVFVAVAVVWVGVYLCRGRAHSARLSASLFILAGAIGTFVAAFSLYTRYSVCHGNWNLCWLCPLDLVGGAALWLRPARPPRFVRPFFGVTGGALILFAAASPFLPQRFAVADWPWVALLAWRALLEARAV